jgi:hypothetical protein
MVKASGEACHQKQWQRECADRNESDIDITAENATAGSGLRTRIKPVLQ